MMQHKQAMHSIIFLVPCTILKRNANCCNLILMESLKKGKRNHCQFYKRSGNGWKQTLPQTIPKTPIYKAINYALKNYNGLVQYTTDGMLPIDNNQLEGQIRAIALGYG